MNAVERLNAAIEKLGRAKSTLGFVAVGADPTDLYVRVDDDTDGDGEFFTYGLSVGGGVDADEEINDALALLARTIDAQLAILRDAHERYSKQPDREPVAPSGLNAVALADAILGDS